MSLLFVKEICNTYVNVVTDITSTFQKFCENNSNVSYNYPVDFWKDIRKYGSFTTCDTFVAVCMALLISIGRYTLTNYGLKPWSRWLDLSKSNEEKLPESAWKTLHYTFTWVYSAYLLLAPGKYDFFDKAEYLWLDWKPQQDIPLDIYILYMVELGFYIHSIYGTIYLDHWRKDSQVMVFHHLISIVLLLFSYSIRYYKVGTLVMFLHDISDVILEFTKCNVYVKTRGGKPRPIHNHVSTIGFLAFASVWFYGRLYWFPLKVLHPAGHFSMYYSPLKFRMPFYVIFNLLLWVILALNLYWFMFILSFLWRVATGQMKEVDDVRESDVIERINKSRVITNGKHHENGVNNGLKKPGGLKKE